MALFPTLRSGARTFATTQKRDRTHSGAQGLHAELRSRSASISCNAMQSAQAGGNEVRRVGGPDAARSRRGQGSENAEAAPSAFRRRRAKKRRAVPYSLFSFSVLWIVVVLRNASDWKRVRSRDAQKANGRHHSHLLTWEAQRGRHVPADARRPNVLGGRRARMASRSDEVRAVRRVPGGENVLFPGCGSRRRL